MEAAHAGDVERPVDGRHEAPWAVGAEALGGVVDLDAEGGGVVWWEGEGGEVGGDGVEEEE